jgi:hypothetical protein
MLMDKDKLQLKGVELPNQKTRKFPVILLISAAVFLSAVSAGGLSVLLLSLSYLMFTISFFLILIAAFNKINVSKLKQSDDKTILASYKFLSPVVNFINNVWIHIKSFYSDEKISLETKSDNSELPAAVSKVHSDGLIEIQKDIPIEHSQESAKPAWAKLETLYVVSFFIIAVWRISRMFTIIPLSHTGFYTSIVDAVLLLVFPCVAITYLKLRKDEGFYAGDKTSYNLLMLLSYVSSVYAAVIAITLVLNINISVVLKWVFYAAMFYLIAALSVNVLFSILRKNVLESFNYTLFPKFSKADGNGASFLDSLETGLNFSLKSLYTVKYALKILPGLILALGFILLLSTTIFVVQPHQQAAVYRFGRLS